MRAAAVVFGRAGSTGLPGKNTRPVAGRPCWEWAVLAARNAHRVSEVYVSTDDPAIIAGLPAYVSLIRRPPRLATQNAPLEDAILHAAGVAGEADTLVVLLANAPCVTSRAIDEALALLAKDERLDSVATACELSAYRPERARRLLGGRLSPWMPGAGSDRGSGTYFTDQGCTALRPVILASLESQPGPFPWQGAAVGCVEQPPGPGDIDYEWQVPAADWWIRTHGRAA